MFQKVVTYRFKVVLFGVTSSPFLLQKILTYHLENHSNPLAKTLISRFYVDNFAHTYVHVDQLKSDYPQINAIMSEASMPLQCWLPESLVQEFQSICQSLSQISAIKFPRCVINPNISDLHIFCDSSAVAYGLVAYAVDSGNKSSNLLMSKVRVAPSPPLTIPKLELLALTLATRLAETLLSNNEFGFRSCTLWTDSEVTISWVYHDKSSEVFVRNRVAEIRTLRRDYNLCILHVPSSQNSADLVTRGVTVSKLAQLQSFPTLFEYLKQPEKSPKPATEILNLAKQLDMFMNEDQLICCPPPLPEERVRYVRPFSSVGVDFTGSITIVDPATASDSERVYVCLFTCTTSRAVHLELCSSLTTSEFLLALRRFGARFGVPSVVISDNGTNFRGAERFLNDIKDEPEVRTYMQDNNIVWKFNTPRSPWSGGFFERLIGSVKSSLHKSLFKKRISFNELRTLLCEIECIINSRPLTYLSEDIREEYLSPSHLIYGRTVTLFPPLNSFGADVPYRENLDLRVQLVTQLIKGNDDVVRSAIVHTADVEYMRPISKLIPLELHHEVIPDVEPIASPIPPAVPNAPPRPKRHAACKAEQLRRDLIDNDLL
ncbi:uncharacterized protein [Macrobrachium rosenbergii]|uniref:uncharacterized protein n=1 Tax=Macrobrachium rosenbergii TaxID=79674 RepID=UPI0034D55AB1